MSCRPSFLVTMCVCETVLLAALSGAADAQSIGDNKTSAASVSAAVQIQPPQATPPKAPVPNRVNDVLPTWLRVRGEFRERAEGFEGAGFVDDRDDAYYLSRFRLHATVTASKRLSFQTQVQDSRVADKSVGPTTAPFRGPFDLRLAFFK